jgi:hypothetical protein
MKFNSQIKAPTTFLNRASEPDNLCVWSWVVSVAGLRAVEDWNPASGQEFEVRLSGILACSLVTTLTELSRLSLMVTDIRR